VLDSFVAEWFPQEAVDSNEDEGCNQRCRAKSIRSRVNNAHNRQLREGEQEQAEDMSENQDDAPPLTPATTRRRATHSPGLLSGSPGTIISHAATPVIVPSTIGDTHC